MKANNEQKTPVQPHPTNQNESKFNAKRKWTQAVNVARVCSFQVLLLGWSPKMIYNLKKKKIFFGGEESCFHFFFLCVF